MKRRLVASMAVGMLAGLVLVPPSITAAAVAPPDMAGLVIGTDGALYTSIRRTFTSGASPIWDHPVPVSPPGTAPAGAAVSAARFPDGNIAAFYVGESGLLHVSYTTGSGLWQPPTPLPVAGVYAPGAHVVTVRSPVGVDTVAVDRRNWIYVTRADFRLPPQRWMGIPAPTNITVPSGSPLSAQPMPGGELGITFVDSGGALTMLRLTSTGTWLSPIRLTNFGAAVPGSTVKMVIANSSPTIFWLDAAGFSHKTIAVGSRPVDQRLIGIPPLPVTAGLSPVALPDGQVALFFAGTNGAVDVLLTTNATGQFGPFTLTAQGIIAPGAKLDLSLAPDSATGWVSVDGVLCPWPFPPGPTPCPWCPPEMAGLSVIILPSGDILSSQLRSIGLLGGVLAGGNVAAVG